METISEDEERIMEAHFEYLKKLSEEGRIIIAGPCLDGSFGIIVFNARDMDEAKTIMEQDPSVKARIMEAELHPFRVSLPEA